MVTSIALLLTLKNYQTLEAFSDNYVLEGKSIIIDWILKKIINLNPRTLAFSGIGAGVYAIVTTIEAVGLWYEKRWNMSWYWDLSVSVFHQKFMN